MKSRVLLAACESEILQTVPPNLLAAGHRVQIAASGLEALRKARHHLPDLIILDSLLPDMDGPTVGEILHCLPSTAAVPTILLAARRVRFVNGATEPDDAPPFNPGELIRRVNQLLVRDTTPARLEADQTAA